MNNDENNEANHSGLRGNEQNNLNADIKMMNLIQSLETENARLKADNEGLLKSLLRKKSRN